MPKMIPQFVKIPDILRLMMFECIKYKMLDVVLNKVRQKMINQQIEDIGTVEELAFKNRELYLKIKLAGLEDRPIDVKGSDIKISEDGAKVRIGKFDSNMPFLDNALNRFLKDKSFAIPEGSARMAALSAKSLFGL